MLIGIGTVYNMSFPDRKKITERFDYHFHIPESGVSAISITVRCQSGEQIQKRGGEDLRVEIDGTIPVSWNGTLLKGLKQTVVFILHLDAGEHTLAFIPREGATIEEITVSPIADLSAINFDREEQAEDGDRH